MGAFGAVGASPSLSSVYEEGGEEAQLFHDQKDYDEDEATTSGSDEELFYEAEEEPPMLIAGEDGTYSESVPKRERKHRESNDSASGIRG